jgi:sugar O-acyltransferase (sialic acid O-acetyltransferase NeuD family)
MKANTLPVRVAIIGSGSLGQQIAQHLNQQKEWQVAGFFDDFAAVGEKTQNGIVLGSIQSIDLKFIEKKFDALLMGIGYNHLAARQKIFEHLVGHVPFAVFVHPHAYVDESASLAPGTFISPGCVLDINVSIGPNTFLYPGCIIAHDTVIAGHTFLAPAVRLAGHVLVEPRCFLGIGTTVIDNVTVGPDVRTGGGATVTKSLTKAGTYIGLPAKHIPNT